MGYAGVPSALLLNYIYLTLYLKAKAPSNIFLVTHSLTYLKARCRPAAAYAVGKKNTASATWGPVSRKLAIVIFARPLHLRNVASQSAAVL